MARRLRERPWKIAAAVAGVLALGGAGVAVRRRRAH